MNFEGSNGATPQYGALVQATDGNLYGMTAFGGTLDCSSGSGYGCGTIYRMTTSGGFTTLYSFPGGASGSMPFAGLVQSGGNFYGTTSGGGTASCGTVFKVTSKGSETVLHDFMGSDGCSPVDTLLNAADGQLYGTTSSGGTGNGGTIFKISPSGTLTTLHDFCQQSNCTDGSNPYAALIQGTDGNFYGTTINGGASDNGTVFKITSTGSFTLLYSFCSQANCADGINPYAALVQARDSNFYGVTSNRGANGTYGTVFKISAQGKLTTLHSFDGTDGSTPTGTLVYASDGNLYGTTQRGGANSFGNIFRITTQGTFASLYSFCSQQDCADGAVPLAGLVQDTNGSFYGQTNMGGPLTTTCPYDSPCGVIYEFSAGLHAFVKPSPMQGKVGTSVMILGTSLTGATSVKFNGVSATFKVVSSSEITATVPAGAKTGYISVVSPSGTLSSTTAFQVQ